ncbi:metallophosphoesterase [Hymenobacter sp. B1770]|uniref:metallophosphoesterase family protein n=1 Tax=Hymenobacter sp. B1770 TaxID=1718788 RepID=UPI003CEF9223
MIKPIRLLTLLLLLLSTACVKRIYYGPEAGNWRSSAAPDSTKLAYTVYLLGDAGAPKTDPPEPALRLLKSQLDADPNSTLVVLGDNLYHKGLSAEGDPGRAEDERRLNGQLYVAQQYKGRVFFVPGNHDWDYSGPQGLVKVRRQEQYIEQKLNRGNTFVPDNGCPGPFVEQVSGEVLFIGLDTEWWLHKHEKPYGLNSTCSAATEEEFLRQLDQALARNRGKHIVVSAHHPLMTNSNHGGYYSVMDHMFPLRLIRDGLYVPLPVIGSLYPYFRQLGGVDQDLPHYRYKLLSERLQAIFRRYDNVVYTAGHDHNLQLHQTEALTHIVSGSGCKTNHIAEGNNATFVHREKGFVSIRYYQNGESWAEFWAPNGDGATGTMHYRGLLHNRNPKTPPPACDAPTPSAAQPTALADASRKPYPLAGTLLKSSYRQAWLTPITLPVLNLTTAQGGLTPFGISTEEDRFLLRLRSGEGHEYSFRPYRRNALGTAPERYGRALKLSLPTKAEQTWLPSQHPYAPLVVGALERAAGLLSTAPQLLRLPDAECLEPYRQQFGGQPGFLEPDAREYQQEKLPGIPGVMQEINYTSLIQQLERSPAHRVDARAFATMRLLDMLVGDWDRHERQYEWVIFKQGAQTIYRPLAKDRDNAFFLFNGLVPRLVSSSWGIRELQHFGPEIRNIKSLNYAARQLDRRLLGSLRPADWKALADSLQQRLPDPVLQAALRRMPPEVYALHGPEILAKLQARRAQLSQVAEAYGKLLARYTDVYGSNLAERFEVERRADGSTVVAVHLAGAPAGQAPFYYRTFRPDETDEIRLYGLQGRDVYNISGTAGSRIKVRVVAYQEKGSYQYGDTSRTRSYTLENTIQDKRILDNTTDTNTDFAAGDLINSPASDRFDYTKLSPSVDAQFNSADGWVVSAGVRYIPYKFRSSPYGASHRLQYQQFFGNNVGRFSYDGEIKNVAFDLDFIGQAWAFAPVYKMPFRGYGHPPAGEAAAPATQAAFGNSYASAALQKPFASFFAVGGGLLYEHFNLRETRNPELRSRLPEGQGAGFGPRNYLGALLYFRSSVKDNEHNPTRGLVMNAQGSWRQGLNSETGRYGRYQYEVRYYMSPDLPLQLTFAGRLGGGLNTGRYAFYQSNMVGGGLLPDFSQTVRGYAHTRLLGDRSLYANLEMRVSLLTSRLYIFPSQLGLLGLYDAGNVWTRQQPGRGPWLSAYGGGAWLALANRLVLSATVASSSEGRYYNLQHGFFF